MSAPSEGHVYIIKAEDGLVKIGISMTPHSRIDYIETSSGRQIVRQFISPLVPAYAELEKALHHHFAGHRGRGEWFSIDFDDAVKAAHMMGAMRFPDHWKRSAAYMQGAIHRGRMRKFSSPSRTVAEWNAFNDGMGEDALAMIRLADDLDDKVMCAGAAYLQELINETIAMFDDLGLSPGAPPQSAFDDLARIRAEIDQDMIELGIKRE